MGKPLFIACVMSVDQMRNNGCAMGIIGLSLLRGGYPGNGRRRRDLRVGPRYFQILGLFGCV
jgi:hypothetical protein